MATPRINKDLYVGDTGKQLKQIKTNADNIATNTTNIANNTTNIATNSSKILRDENFMEIGLSARYNTTLTGWQNHIINYNKTDYNNGSMFTRDGNKIKIGSGVNYVLAIGICVSAISTSNAEDDCGFIKNGSTRYGHTYNASNGTLRTMTIAQIIPVSNGDYIQHYNNTGYSGSATYYETSRFILVALC